MSVVMTANSPAMAANFSVKQIYVIAEPMLEIILMTGPEIPGNPNTTFFITISHSNSSLISAFNVSLDDSYNGNFS